MRAAQCPQCGATLPATRPEGRLTCEFCGSVLEATPPRSRVPPAADDRDATVRAAMALGRRLLLVFLVAIAGVGLLVWSVVHAVTRWVSAAARRPLPRIEIEADGPLAPADLATSRFSGREVRLDAAPPLGGFADVDAALNLPWALTLAQAWKRDVRLDRADVERMRPDGTANCRDDADAEVRYRFVSPERVEELERQRDLADGVEGEWELWVTIRRGAVWVRTIRSRSLPPYVERYTASVRERVASAAGEVRLLPPFPAVPPLRQIVARAAQDRRWVARPFYKAYLLYAPDRGWAWSIGGLAGRDNFPWIRASDGKMAPFDR